MRKEYKCVKMRERWKKEREQTSINNLLVIQLCGISQEYHKNLARISEESDKNISRISQ